MDKADEQYQCVTVAAGFPRGSRFSLPTSPTLATSTSGPSGHDAHFYQSLHGGLGCPLRDELCLATVLSVSPCWGRSLCWAAHYVGWWPAGLPGYEPWRRSSVWRSVHVGTRTAQSTRRTNGRFARPRPQTEPPPLTVLGHLAVHDGGPLASQSTSFKGRLMCPRVWRLYAYTTRSAR